MFFHHHRSTSRRRLGRKPLRVETLEQRRLLAADGIADAIYINGQIYSVQPDQDWQSSVAEAIAIDGGQIMAIGTNAEVFAFAADTTKYFDLDGRMVLPGFHDVHTRLLDTFAAVSSVQLAPNTELRDLLPSLTDQQPHDVTGWVLGGGQTIDQFYDLTEYSRDILDEAILDTPAAMLEAGGHSLWVNSAGLAAAGITTDTPDPHGGVIDRDPDSGEPTGLLIDNAIDLVLQVALARSNELDELGYQQLLQNQKLANQLGITSVAEANVDPSFGHDEIWIRSETESEVSLRANLGLWVDPNKDDTLQIADLAGRFNNDASSLVKVNEISIAVDGVTENGSAGLIDPYNTELYAGEYGLNSFAGSRLDTYLTELESTGFAFAIQATGDAAIHNALNAIENVAGTHSSLGNQHHRITHTEIVHPDDYVRFEALDVIADFQVGSDFLDPAKREFLREQIGDRADSILPVHSLAQTGATVVFSSDFNVNSLNPLVGIEQSLTRGDNENLPELKDAIEAYTIDAAIAMRQDETVGSLARGKLADWVILDQNLFNIAPNRIDETRVLLTVLGGETVHGDSLTLTLAADEIVENRGATTATLTRSSTAGELLVKLTSNDTSEATVPDSVTFADGQASISFSIDGVDDSLDDDVQRVTIKAEATDHLSALAYVTVVDDDPLGLDFGDAPTAAQTGFQSDYPVTIQQNGAAHVVGDLRLGKLLDPDLDGQPLSAALGDDGDGTDDEDGVTLSTTMIAENDTPTIANFSVTVSDAGKIDAWIDFDHDGVWGGEGEQVATSIDVLPGVNAISIELPAGTIAGDTALRVRLSTTGGLLPIGTAVDGEVEDEWIQIHAGSLSVNAKVATSYNGQPDGPIVIATDSGRTSVRDQATDFFDAANASFGGLAVFGAPQDETFVIDASTLLLPSRGITLNGGGGANQLNLSGDAVLSLVDNSFRFANFTTIDMTAPGSTTLSVDAVAIRTLSPTDPVRIINGPDDQIHWLDAADWRFVDPIMQDGQFVSVIENAVSGNHETVQFNSFLPWHNIMSPHDVDNSGEVTPNDILEVINQLVDRQYIQPDSDIPLPPDQVAVWPNRFYDTSGDNTLTPNDILEVINFLAEKEANTPGGEWIAENSPALTPVSDRAATNLQAATNLHNIAKLRDGWDETQTRPQKTSTVGLGQNSTTEKNRLHTTPLDAHAVDLVIDSESSANHHDAEAAAVKSMIDDTMTNRLATERLGIFGR